MGQKFYQKPFFASRLAGWLAIFFVVTFFSQIKLGAERGVWFFGNLFAVFFLSVLFLSLFFLEVKREEETQQMIRRINGL